MRQAGFTFIEMLLAIFIFSFAMVSALQVFPLNRRLLQLSGQQTEAVFLAQEEAELLQGYTYAALTTGTFEAQHYISGSSSDPLTQFQRSTTVSLIDSSYNPTATDIGLKKVVITVNWTFHGINRSYTLTTYASNT